MSGSRATAALRAGSSISSGKPQLDSATKTPLSIKTMPSADDHFSFIRRGVAGCDLIDFSIPYWHTTEDRLDRVDPKSLGIVGQVLAATFPRFEKKFP